MPSSNPAVKGSAPRHWRTGSQEAGCVRTRLSGRQPCCHCHEERSTDHRDRTHAGIAFSNMARVTGRGRIERCGNVMSCRMARLTRSCYFACRWGPPISEQKNSPGILHSASCHLDSASDVQPMSSWGAKSGQAAWRVCDLLSTLSRDAMTSAHGSLLINLFHLCRLSSSSFAPG